MFQIAIIDDSASACALMAELVEEISDCGVITFTDAAPGLDWICANEIDLLIVDYMMPDFDGIRLIERFRHQRGEDTAPVIMVTSSESRDVRYMALQMGATDFISKPIDPVEFIARVRNVLSGRQARLQLAEANAAKSAFLATMSHEIRTPANAIIGLAELALRGGHSAAKLDDYFAKIRESGQILLSVINSVLDFSKIDADRLELEHTDFDLGGMLRHVENMLVEQVRKKGLAMRVTIAPDLPRFVTGDSLRLSQILLNLLSNAVKFTDQGEINLTVSPLRAEAGHAHLGFVVSDTGIGISAADQRRLFKPYAQADSSISRRFGGSGLGLTIAARLVRMMGGAIGVESTPGLGSTFSFDVTLGIAAGPAEIEAEWRLPRNLAGARLLLVEDNEINQMVASEFLRLAGIAVTIAADGRAGVAAVQEQAFDGVLMDVQMPVLDGYQATREIRGDPRFAGLPIIAMTADVMPGDREKALAAGMNDHVAKPFEPKELWTVLERWVRPPDLSHGQPPPRARNSVT